MFSASTSLSLQSLNRYRVFRIVQQFFLFFLFNSNLSLSATVLLILCLLMLLEPEPVDGFMRENIAVDVEGELVEHLFLCFVDLKHTMKAVFSSFLVFCTSTKKTDALRPVETLSTLLPHYFYSS